MLINKLKENTKKAFNKLMNRFSKERWAQSRTVGDPPWIGNPDYGKPKFNPDEARYELDQACRKKAGDITERFIEEIWMELGIDTSDVPYKEPNGLQIEMKACEKWGQSWWDNYGEKLLDDWISRNTDSDTHFNEDDAEEVFSNENIGREMLESFAPAYALLLSKITNLSKDILERIKNYK
jgi:hypothetical protein